MKTTCKVLFLGMGILLGCTKETPLNTIEPLSSEPASVTLPFIATYQGYNSISDQNQGVCSLGFKHIVEIANGNGSLVGFSTFHSDFCSNTGTIKPGYSYITTQNGDTIYLTFSGKTCIELGENENEKNDHSNAICYWKIPFTILGGTGIFKNVMGGGTTDDYLSSVDNNYYHSWEGTITISRKSFQELQQY
jgi:hypothetical protein